MPTKKVSYPISFRADGALLTSLERGASRYGISVHEYARQRLVELFENKDEARLLAEAEATRQSVNGLRDDLAATLEVLLLNTTKSKPDQIRDWIDTNLRQDSQ